MDIISRNSEIINSVLLRRRLARATEAKISETVPSARLDFVDRDFIVAGGSFVRLLD